MDEIRIDDIIIRRNESGLIIADGGRSGLDITLDADHLPKIIEFLNSYSASPGQHENRNGFRIPIAELGESTLSQFSVSIEIDGCFFRARAIDFSVGGAQVEVVAKKVLQGDRASVLLNYSDMNVTVDAGIVRINGNRLCLNFLPSMTPENPGLPEKLLHIYRALEMDWLRERIS